MAKRGINLFSLFIIVITFSLLTIYVTIAFAAQDVFWFGKGFSERPTKVIVYSGGEAFEYQPGQPEYDLLAEAVRASLAEGVYRQSGLGLSEQSLQDAYQRFVSVEAFFDRPVKLHAGFNTGHPTQMLFLITGRHSEMNLVLLGVDNNYRTNPPVLNTIEPVRKVLIQLGFTEISP